MNKSHFTHIIFWSLVSFLFSTCDTEKTETETLDWGYAYFPLSVGNSLAYDLDSVVHDGFNASIDTFRSQFKEVVESSYLDLEERTAYRIERYWRKSDTLPWVLQDVVSCVPEQTRITCTENNLAIIKLTFPIHVKDNWDGYAYNSETTKKFEYVRIDQPFQVNNFNFDSTLTVVQVTSAVDTSTLLHRIVTEERYVKNVGLVYKEEINIDFQNDDGFERYLKINSYNVQ